MVLYEYGWLSFSKIVILPAALFLFIFIAGLDFKKAKHKVVLIWFFIFGFMPLFFIGNHLYTKLSYEFGFYKEIVGDFASSEELNPGREAKFFVGTKLLTYSLTQSVCFTDRLLELDAHGKFLTKSVGPFDIPLKNGGKNMTVKYIGPEDYACIVYISAGQGEIDTRN
jgi:hypothetical protein